MAFTVGDFYSDLRTMHKRGASLDDELPGATRRAVRWLEQNYTLQYMRRLFVGTIAAGSNVIVLPEVPFKAIRNLRFVYSDGTVRALRNLDLEADNPDVDDVLADGYVLDGMEQLLLNRAVLAATDFRGTIVRYSDFPRAENATHWLLQNAESFLRCQAMLELAVFLRDDRTFQIYVAMRDQQLQVLQNADYEARYSDQTIIMGQG